MSSQLRRNGDGILTDCLCFGACCFPCPSISLLLAMFAMHHHSHSLSLLPPPPSLPHHFSEGMGAMDGHPATCEEKTVETLVISEHCVKLWSSTTQRHNATGSFQFSRPFLFCLYLTPSSPSLPPLHPPIYLRLHVIVCQPNLSNQQIRPKIIGGGLAASARRAVYR